MASNPAVVLNRHRLGKFDILPPAADIGLVGSGEDGHVGAEHDTVTNGYESAVEDAEVEVGVEALANLDIAPVVDGEGRVDADLVAVNGANDFLEQLCSLLANFVRVGRVLGKVIVVVHCPFAGLEADGLEFRDEGVIPRRHLVSVQRVIKETEN